MADEAVLDAELHHIAHREAQRWAPLPRDLAVCNEPDEGVGALDYGPCCQPRGAAERDQTTRPVSRSWRVQGSSTAHVTTIPASVPAAME